jgi:hypothetical protein
MSFNTAEEKRDSDATKTNATIERIPTGNLGTLFGGYRRVLMEQHQGLGRAVSYFDHAQ